MAHLYDNGKTTLVVLPMLSMHEQYLHWCTLQNILCDNWSPHMSETNSPAIVLVPVELSESQLFRDYARRLFGLDLLARMFIDEAHLFETHASFRDVMDTIAWFASIGVQICDVSATVPIAFEPILFQRFGVTTYETIRIWSPRPEISYNVHVVPDRRVAVIQKYHECAANMTGNEGILVFCNAVSEAESLAKDLVLVFIHGHLARDDLKTRINDL
jgi:superfamily II DNA helicase RecQ